MASSNEIIKAYKSKSKQKKNKDPFGTFVNCMSQAIIFEKKQHEQNIAKEKQLEEQKRLQIKQDQESTKKHLESIFSTISESLKKETLEKSQSQEQIEPVQTNNGLKTFLTTLSQALKEETKPSILETNLLQENFTTENLDLSSTNPNEEQQENSEIPQTVETSTKSNPYVDELAKSSSKILDSEPEDIKRLKSVVSSQLSLEINKIRELFPNIGMSSGTGGGTNAVQFAEGGTMNGNLNVEGKYLSGGIDLSEIFSTYIGGSSSPSNKLISGSQSVTLSSNGVFLFDVSDNNIAITTPLGYKWVFDNNGVLKGPSDTLLVESLDTQSNILSAGTNLSDIFARKDIIDCGNYF